ncbi:mRNA-decapping enzyme subunit 2 [Cladophialophora chaetospira]|uniref:mRNA-decapping enzyme subunit 2 n=1 Tax=Cladophialophora chaetospira TaxID=386627 RepID=A0AA38WXG6_9EURO|nr:mRNA-decapping enzyme subunit 2 [Cladophialophora chaetospira]
MQLEDWLDDLCVRFIINLPPEELESVERICFQVEEAQWFYEDFIRPLDPSLPSLSLRAFSLRIFQHCPLFSQWSAQHHTTAFAEFLAYKSRVPVRGAILLNEAMDEVVLVKGWKKSANWSFPRGKINKDENDLDCAVREVYEETGFDAREAGLVRDEKEMKYIEITMREQHMRLYVFRGVPRDTHFEAKTRKEISKIEWYKLTDLPTLKKNRQHEGSGTDHVSVNANKFYMVAPFLNPLKKWIVQQRKKENRYSSHLSAPPIVAEDATTEEERDTDGAGARLAETGPKAISDLPEVSTAPAVDPASHLKEMLNIGTQPIQPQLSQQPNHMPQIDTQKSNALLALLRGRPQGQSGTIPQTPMEQIASPPDILRSPHVSHVRMPQLDHTQPPPPFRTLPQSQIQPTISEFFPSPQEPPIRPGVESHPSETAPQVAPYQRTGDPLSRPQGGLQNLTAAIPPASALPKLTNHTRALLDVFKAGPSTSNPALPPIGAARSNALPRSDSLPQPQVSPPNVSGSLGFTHQVTRDTSRGFASPANAGLESQVSALLSSRPPQSTQRNPLLELFNQKSTARTVSAIPPATAPVELAATAAHTPPEKPQANKDELLLALLRQGNHDAPRKTSETVRPAPREGETAATVNGPLNQPEFEAVSKTTRHITNELGRSPLTANRTLFDPNAPTPVKILSRSDDPRPPPPQSPRGIRPSSKRPARDKATPKEQNKEQAKPFQPQILRRPPPVEGPTTSMLPPQREAPAQQSVSTVAAPSPAVSDADTLERSTPSRKPSHADAQKQTLLSLFGGSLDTTPRATALQPSPGIVSPLTTSQIMSPNGEGPGSGIEPISTRTSRVGSMTSMFGGPASGRAPAEKRQTGAENKAFLLGYLGRIATQEK